MHYTQGLAHQLAGRVRANTVSPGNVYFPGGVWESIEANDPDLYAHALGLNPTGRMARPEEIARAVTFLASPAASFVSGTNLLVDGALSATRLFGKPLHTDIRAAPGQPRAAHCFAAC